MKTFQCSKKVLALIFLSLLICACIEFKMQQMYWSHDESKDELTIVNIFDDIYAGEAIPDSQTNSNVEISAKEIEQLKSVFEQKRAFFFNNWISQYNSFQLAKHLEELKSKTAAEKDFSHHDQLQLCQLLHKSVAVQQGDFYLNEKGQLCGWQKITVGNVKEILKLGTDLLVTMFKEDIRQKKEYLQGVTLEDIETKISINIKKNQLMLCLPIPYKDYMKARRKLVDKSATDIHPFLYQLLQQDFHVNYKDGALEIIAGKPGEKVNSIVIRDLFKGESNKALIKHVKTNYSLKENLDVNELLKSIFGKGQAASTPAK